MGVPDTGRPPSARAISGSSNAAAARILVRMVKKLKNFSDEAAIPANVSPRTSSQYCMATQKAMKAPAAAR